MLKRLLTLGALVAGGAVIAKQLKQKQGADASSVQESIDVNVPVGTAYNQWTQFEEFPQFMDSVHEIQQLDDTRLLWRADVAGKLKEWEAKITEQVPDMRIAWCSVSGAHNAGVVTFHRLSDTTTRIMLQMEYQPEGLVEAVGDMVGAMRFEAKNNLNNFKRFIEARRSETGAWRGVVAQQH